MSVKDNFVGGDLSWNLKQQGKIQDAWELWNEIINFEFSLEIWKTFNEYVSATGSPGIEYRTTGACKLIPI